MTAVRPIEGPEVWRGEDLARSSDWIHTLGAAEQDDLEVALRAVQRRGLGWRELTREEFVIPRWTRSLADIRARLEHGRGLVLLRRIPVERYNSVTAAGHTQRPTPAGHAPVRDA